MPYETALEKMKYKVKACEEKYQRIIALGYPAPIWAFSLFSLNKPYRCPACGKRFEMEFVFNYSFGLCLNCGYEYAKKSKGEL